MKNKKGFTLSEVMVTMGILGILAAIIIPAVTKLTPDNNKVMFKKAYYTAEKAVSDLINDDSLYPSSSIANTTDTTPIVGVQQGFFNTVATGMGLPASNDKFCYFFSQRLNTVSANCTNATVAGVPAYTFTTTDGVVWTYTLQATPFKMDATTYLTTDVLSVDVNGAKAPNCFTVAPTACTAGVFPDRFRLRIRYDGKMGVDSADTKAIAILTTPTDNKK